MRRSSRRSCRGLLGCFVVARLPSSNGYRIIGLAVAVGRRPTLGVPRRDDGLPRRSRSRLRQKATARQGHGGGREGAGCCGDSRAGDEGQPANHRSGYRIQRSSRMRAPCAVTLTADVSLEEKILNRRPRRAQRMGLGALRAQLRVLCDLLFNSFLLSPCPWRAVAFRRRRLRCRASTRRDWR